VLADKPRSNLPARDLEPDLGKHRHLPRLNLLTLLSMKDHHNTRSKNFRKERVFWENIQILRIVAAYAIVYVHLASVFTALHAGPMLVDVLRFGTDLFVVISGFLTAQILVANKKSSGEYLLNRSIRIIPLYVIFTVLAFFTKRCFTASDDNTIRELLMSLAFIPYGPYPILHPTWTLEVIVEFTLIIAACQWLSRIHGIYLALLSVVMIVFIGELSRPSTPMVIFWTNSILIDFALGICVFRLVSGNFMSNIKGPAGLVAACFIIVVCFIVITIRPLRWPEVPRFLSLGLPAAGMLFAVLMLEFMGVAFRSGFTDLLAKSSYSVYLCHRFVNGPAEKILVATGSSHVVALIFLVLVPVVVSCVAILTYIYVEAPITSYLVCRSAPGRKPRRA
jgi:exopolysaccharide production protein ExoZ